jgi:two-component system sensor histidine kinase BarA
VAQAVPVWGAIRRRWRAERKRKVAESILQKKLVLGELLDLPTFTQVCKTFVDLYKIGLKVFDANGTKLVDIKIASGDFCAYMFTGPNGRRLCTETVTHIKVRPLEEPQIAVRNCFSGLRYLMLPILYEGDMLGRIIFGPFFPEDVGDLGQELKSLEGEFDLAKARDLIGRIRRAPESTVRKVLDHFARLVDVLVFTSHKALITSQLHIESVTESYREVQEKNKKLSEALERLQELSRLKSNFLATVSHELRTPLTSVIGYSEMLLAGLAGDLNDEQKDYLKTILDKGESLLRLISSILDLSRIEARGVQLQRNVVDVNDILQTAVESVLPQSFKKKLTVSTEVSPSIQRVQVDPDKIRQCVINLLSNSVKFTPAGGHIAVRAGPAQQTPQNAGPFGGEGYFQIQVEDNGIGIPKDLQSKVFDTFFQADSSASREYGGAGLGLSIVKSYVEAHGGGISVRSEPGKGSIFTLVVPMEPPGAPLESSLRGAQ